MKVKICGLRDRANIEDLKKLPIDFMGFIFYPNSPRDVSQDEELKNILDDDHWNSEIKKVGVFVNMQIHDILHYVHDYHLDFVQLHGNESPEYCRELNSLWSISTVKSAKIIKSFSIESAEDFEDIHQYERHCAYFLFDTKGKSPGGNGVTFDWNLLENYKGITPFLLSGGIGEEHAQTIKTIQVPQFSGIDINSKFESKPALKNVKNIKKFLQALDIH